MAAGTLKKTALKKAVAKKKAVVSSSRKGAPSGSAQKVITAKKAGGKVLHAPKTAVKKTTASKRPAAKTVSSKPAAKNPAKPKSVVQKAAPAKTAAKKTAAPKAAVKRTVAPKTPPKTSAKKTITPKPAAPKTITPKAAAPTAAAAQKPLQKADDSQDRLRNIKKSLLLKKEHILKEVKEEISKYVSGENKQLVDTALDDGDWAVVDISEDINLLRLSAHRKLMHSIDEATRKITEGTYGICEDCGEEISEKRLLVLPTATLCIDCQEQKEQFEAFEVESEE